MSHRTARSQQIPASYQQVARDHNGLATTTAHAGIRCTAMIEKGRDDASKKNLRHLRRSCAPSSAEPTWTWEILGGLLCLCTLAGIFGLLAAYDQTPLPHSIAGISVDSTQVAAYATPKMLTIV
jgi:hypothetical protein